MGGEVERTLPGEGLLCQAQGQEVQTPSLTVSPSIQGTLEGVEWLEVGSGLEHLLGKQSSFN